MIQNSVRAGADFLAAREREYGGGLNVYARGGKVKQRWTGLY